MQILITLKTSYSISLLAKFPMQFFSSLMMVFSSIVHVMGKTLFRDLQVKLTRYKRPLLI